jgi:hypothetical protein
MCALICSIVSQVGAGECAMMSVHDALEAWDAGEITSARAMQLTGALDVMELRAFAHQSGIELRTHLLPREEEQATLATALISRLLRAEGADGHVEDEPTIFAG